MRTNLPVTQREFEFEEDEILVSTTDLDSRITYFNPPFLRVSGFDEGELQGQPHNLIRHPDMPAEAFRDLWQTLRSGRPWSAVVKNRRKNGDHYWVYANVTPVLEQGRHVGYMSVRTKATPEQIAAADRLYARMRGEAATGRVRTRLEAGHLVVTGWRGLFARAGKTGLTARMTFALLLLMAAAEALLMFTHEEGVVIATIGVLAQLALLAGLATWLHRSVTVPVQRATRQVYRMAAGELAAVGGNARRDELGQLLGGLAQLNVNLKALVGDVRREATQISAGATEIAAANQSLSSRTESQASSLQEAAAAVEQIATSARLNAESANDATVRARAAGEVAQRGGAVVTDVIRGMREIERSAEQIASINSVVDGIAFQTNILALNAAVEAARAGDAGRGFAVVASEVRSLAQRSADAAKEIKRLVEESRAAVQSGARTAESAGSTLEEVCGSARELQTIVEAISCTSGEQSTGVTQLNSAVSEMDQGAQQNAAMVEQTSASAQQLRVQAGSLLAAVQVFR